ncbi:MAG: hypothetical protein HWN67_17980 [Candidatus Helarchaeota archaeon]|nr:hypothetical protein [Candidatus Helarchaeota archaeon]
MKKEADNLNTPYNIIQIIKIFLENMENFSGLLHNKMNEITNFFQIEINQLNEKYFNNTNFSTFHNKMLLKKGINKQQIIKKIKSSSSMKIRENDKFLLIQSYHKSLELAKLLEIYSNMCINIFIKNYSFDDILHAKTNLIMKEIYNKITLEKDLLIT